MIKHADLSRRIRRIEKSVLSASSEDNGIPWHLKRTANACRTLGFGLGNALRKLEKGQLKLTKDEQKAFVEAARLFNSKVKAALKAVVDKAKKK